MPLEVNEIGIAMRVRDNALTESESRQTRETSEEEREELIEECVRRVLQALKIERER